MKEKKEEEEGRFVLDSIAFDPPRSFPRSFFLFSLCFRSKGRACVHLMGGCSSTMRMTEPDSPRPPETAARNEVVLLLGILASSPFLSSHPPFIPPSSGPKKTGKSTLFHLVTFREKLRGSEFTVNMVDHLMRGVAEAIQRLLKGVGPIPRATFENPDLQVSSRRYLGLLGENMPSPSAKGKPDSGQRGIGLEPHCPPSHHSRALEDPRDPAEVRAAPVSASPGSRHQMVGPFVFLFLSLFFSFLFFTAHLTSSLPACQGCLTTLRDSQRRTTF